MSGRDGQKKEKLKNVTSDCSGPALSLKENNGMLTAIVLLVSFAVLLAGIFFLRSDKAKNLSGDYSEYERAKITKILADSTEKDPASDGAYRGDQLLIAEVKTGQYKGKTMQVYNYVGPLYGVPLKEGDSAILVISTYASGEIRATVFEYGRFVPLLIVLGLFVLATVLVGKGTGAKSLIALGLTVVCLFTVLLPALLRGAPTVFTTFALSVYITVVSLTIIGGIGKKTLCAMAGTVAGTGFAALFGLLSQALLRINGLRLADVEPLLQLRQTGEHMIGLKGLLVAGVVISAIGAVMDVAMSISSALSEIRDANPSYGFEELFRSGMNIGRDMVGTMTNTLILAFMGSSFTLMLYLYSLDLSFHQLMSSAYVSIEVISGISCSVGLILAIPLTALVSAAFYGGKKK